jgi:hypothetical protein
LRADFYILLLLHNTFLVSRPGVLSPSAKLVITLPHKAVRSKCWSGSFET